MPGDANDELRSRLVRLEEAQGFAERTVEQLGDEVRVLGRRISELQAQVRRLETQLLRLSSPSADPEDGDGDASDQQ